jgi:hypothetical protein
MRRNKQSLEDTATIAPQQHSLKDTAKIAANGTTITRGYSNKPVQIMTQFPWNVQMDQFAIQFSVDRIPQSFS